MTTSNVSVRKAYDSDMPFVLGLSPVLADMAQLPWHSDEVIQSFQSNYIKKMILDEDSHSAFFVAEEEGVQLGFIYVSEHHDEISGEKCATIPLLAVTPLTQGKGVGSRLLQEAERWALAQSYRLLHLEVFNANKKGLNFYQRNDFKPDTLSMIKELKPLA